jgi:hypothetical protein
MPGPISTTPPGIQDPLGARATAVLGPNTRVRGAQGFVGTAADTVLFPGGPPPAAVVGRWIVPNTRVLVGGVPTVGAASQGLAFTIVPFPSPTLVAIGPMIASTSDPKINNS